MPITEAGLATNFISTFIGFVAHAKTTTTFPHVIDHLIDHGLEFLQPIT
jgi:hypothetical protein